MIETAKQPKLLTSALPSNVMDVFKHYFTAELTSLSRNGAPITWPIMPIFWEQRGLIVALTSIGLPQKALNIRRNPKVALLFSDSTGSELTQSPTVLVQGTATVEDRIFVSQADATPELVEVILIQARKMIQRQPSMSLYMSNPITRFLMDWYFMRLLITILPRNILWWENGDYAHPPHHLEVSDVV